MPFTSPESLGTAYLHAIEPGGDNVVLRTEYMEIERVVYMDGRSPPAGERTIQGHSVGRWEGDVLVVETTHFADQRWGNARGIPSGAQKRVVERFRLTDSGETLTIDFALADPEYLTEPFSGSEQWRYGLLCAPPSRYAAKRRLNIVRRHTSLPLLSASSLRRHSCMTAMPLWRSTPDTPVDTHRRHQVQLLAVPAQWWAMGVLRVRHRQDHRTSRVND